MTLGFLRKQRARKTISPRALALEQQTTFRFKGQAEIFCAQNDSNKNEHLHRRGPSTDHNNRIS